MPVTPQRARWLPLAVLVASTCASVVLGVAPASAAETAAETAADTAAGTADCDGTTCTVTFGLTGRAQAWQVPAGVRTATVDLSGAAGGDGGVLGAYSSPDSYVVPGGRGARVRATLPVTPGETLQVQVGGKGFQGRTNAEGPGPDRGALDGYNGGGSLPLTDSLSGVDRAGGGGGASDVRRGPGLADRLLVAAGGGGGGGCGRPHSPYCHGNRGGAGGASGRTGLPGEDGSYWPSTGLLVGSGGDGGARAIGAAGGAGGTAGVGDGTAGEAGRPGLGGQGGASPHAAGEGGGGGGGHAGGGGGGGGGGYYGRPNQHQPAGGGGGGGGSNLVAGSQVLVQDGVRSGDGAATITYADPASPTGTRHLSDLPWASASSAWGPVERDRSNGEQAAGDGGPLVVQDRTYATGLGVHAASDLRFVVPPGCTRFSATVGVDDEVGDRGSVVFRVFDGTTQVYDSGTLTGSSVPLPVFAPVTPGSLLGLVVTDAGDGDAYDHADWAEARLTCGSSTRAQPVSELAWASEVSAWGPVERDRSNGQQAAGDGGPLVVQGRTYAKGLGVHAASDLRFVVPDGCYAFSAVVGLDDEVGDRGSVVFQVFNGTRRVYDSGTVTGASAGAEVWLPVTSGAVLGLVVTDAGDGDAYDHADWADAALTCSART